MDDGCLGGDAREHAGGLAEGRSPISCVLSWRLTNGEASVLTDIKLLRRRFPGSAPNHAHVAPAGPCPRPDRSRREPAVRVADSGCGFEGDLRQRECDALVRAASGRVAGDLGPVADSHFGAAAGRLRARLAGHLLS